MNDYELAKMYETVNLYRRGGAAKIELNRPETRNAWNTQFSVDLLAALRETGDDPRVRAVLVTGAGKAFSSGADLRENLADRTADGPPDVYGRLTQQYHPIIMGIREMPKPVVAGLAAGPTRSYAGTKRQLNKWLYDQMDAQLELEARIQQEAAGSADFVEGVIAFSEKRAPSFTGA